MLAAMRASKKEYDSQRSRSKGKKEVIVLKKKKEPDP